jgi:hypothetical protein
MKTYLVAALALALAVGTVPAMAKSDSGGGGGGHGSTASEARQAISSNVISHDTTPNAVGGPTIAPALGSSLSSRCAAVLAAPRGHSKAQVDYCVEQRG